MTAGQRIYKQTTHYLPGGRSVSLQEIHVAHQDAEAGSAQLRDDILAMFARFEADQGLPQGWGQHFQLSGYRP